MEIKEAAEAFQGATDKRSLQLAHWKAEREKAQQLLDYAEKQLQAAQIEFSLATEDALNSIIIDYPEGKVTPALLHSSPEQVIMALPNDQLLVIREDGSKHTYIRAAPEVSTGKPSVHMYSAETGHHIIWPKERLPEVAIVPNEQKEVQRALLASQEVSLLDTDSGQFL